MGNPGRYTPFLVDVQESRVSSASDCPRYSIGEYLRLEHDFHSHRELDRMEFSESILQRLKKGGVVAGFSVENIANAVPITRALLQGGIDAIELTLRTDATPWKRSRSSARRFPKC